MTSCTLTKNDNQKNTFARFFARSFENERLAFDISHGVKIITQSVLKIGCRSLPLCYIAKMATIESNKCEELHT